MKSDLGLKKDQRWERHWGWVGGRYTALASMGCLISMGPFRSSGPPHLPRGALPEWPLPSRPFQSRAFISALPPLLPASPPPVQAISSGPAGRIPRPFSPGSSPEPPPSAHQLSQGSIGAFGTNSLPAQWWCRDPRPPMEGPPPPPPSHLPTHCLGAMDSGTVCPPLRPGRPMRRSLESESPGIWIP